MTQQARLHHRRRARYILMEEVQMSAGGGTSSRLDPASTTTPANEVRSRLPSNDIVDPVREYLQAAVRSELVPTVNRPAGRGDVRLRHGHGVRVMRVRRVPRGAAASGSSAGLDPASGRRVLYELADARVRMLVDLIPHGQQDTP